MESNVVRSVTGIKMAGTHCSEQMVSSRLFPIALLAGFHAFLRHRYVFITTSVFGGKRIEILGCPEYGCNNATVRRPNRLLLEFWLQRAYSKHKNASNS
jgi:hypothetical protein